MAEAVSVDPNGTLDPEDYADEADAKAREERGDFQGFYSLGGQVDTQALAETNNFRGQSGNNKAMMDEINAFMRSKGMKAGLNYREMDESTRRKVDEQYPNSIEDKKDDRADTYKFDWRNMKSFLEKSEIEEWEKKGLGPHIFPKDGEDIKNSRDYEFNPAFKEYLKTLPPTDLPKKKWDEPETDDKIRGRRMMLGGPTTFDPASNQDWYKAVEGWFDAVDNHIAQAESTGISQGGAKAISWLARGIIGEPLRALRELQETDLSRTPSSMPVDESNPVAAAAGRPKAIETVTQNTANVGILSTVAPAPKGALRVFGGTDAAENLAKAGMPQAQTSIEIATMLEKKGVSEAKIREVTRSLADEGGFGNVSKAADGQWVIEIPANKMEITDFEKIKTKGAQYLDEVVKFDELFKAMPEAKDVKVIVQKVHPNMKNFRPSGDFTAPDQIRIVARHAEDVKDVIVHEIEHYAQNYRKGAYGANNDFDGDYAYNYSAGELQANSSQIRQEMTAQELSEIHPRMHEQTSDGKIIPRSEQIVRTREEWETGKRAAAQSSNRDLASDTAPRDWVPVGGDKKHLHKDYVLVDTTTGRPVGSATTKDRADKAAGKRGGREDEASTVKAMKTQDWLDQQWNGPEMKRWRETQLERHGVQSVGGFFDGKKMSAKDIGDHERRIARSLKTNLVSKEKLERDLKTPDRFSATVLKQKEHGLASYNERIDQLNMELAELTKIKEAKGFMDKNTEFKEPAAAPLQQGVPKTLSEDIGKMPKRRSKLERLREDKESLETVLTLETRIPRLERAKKHLKKVESDLDKITGE